MLTSTFKTYRAALILWGLVSLAAGFTIGSIMRLPGRQLGFVVILTAGVYVLVVQYIFQRPTRRSQSELAAKQTQVGDQASSTAADIADLIEEGVVFSPVEAREWLDRFLVKQQQK